MEVNIMKSKAEWWKSAVAYQLYPRSFYDTNNDGIGDIKGIIEKLDYLNDGTENSLGIDAIWLNPVYPSPQYDFGYDIMDYEGIDPQYGTMADFDKLLAEAHKRGIRILMDIVPSVTSHLHPWFIESRSSKDSPKRDWYLWVDGKQGKYPNKWLGMFGGRAWDWDGKTRQYYYHNSLPEQPDLNWKNPEVAKAVLGAMEFWLKKGVDGFRVDVLNFSHKDSELRNNPYCLGIRPYDMQKHIYDRNRPEALEVGKAMRALADKYEDKMLVGEIFINDVDEAVKYYGENNDGMHLVFNFAFMHSKFKASSFKKNIQNWLDVTKDKGWPSYFLSNHDIPRHISRYAKGKWTLARAKLAIALLLTLKGTPFIYMGEEIGMLDVKIKKHQLMDSVGKHYFPFHRGRDRARTPLQWTSEEYAGFSKQEPWLPVHKDYKEINVEQAERDPNSLLHTYRKLIWLRKKTEALGLGEFAFYEKAPKNVLAYFRTTEQETVLVALNMGKQKRILSLDADYQRAQVLFSTSGDKQSIDLNKIELSAYQGLILSLQKA